MKRILPFVLACSGLMLVGCSDADWDHAMNYAGVGDQQVASATPTPAQAIRPAPATAAPDTNFCQAVAKQDAAGDGFDVPTQQRIFQRSFQQCIALFGAGDPASHGTVAANP